MIPTTAFDVEEVAALKHAAGGPVLLPGEAGYREETAPFNLAVPQRPAIVVGATSAGDVQAAVRFAGWHGLPVGVLATGHGAAVSCDGAVLINTRRLSRASVDAARGT